ncbi:Variant SH3 domain containing protein [Aphelenchoides bicaudatus]|nr:Variant SH3 domain containing protein [Aphelenchoides bicaudatus]
MGQCCSKNAETEQELVTPHQMPANNTVCTPILNGAAHPSQIKLQPTTPSFYKPQNSSFQSQSHLNTSASSDGRRKDFGGGSNEDTVIALFPYESRSEGDLSFQKNDIMLLLESKDADWWFVRHTKDGRTGYVPRNFVALRKSLESEEWFAGNIQRSMAERLVLSSGTPIGTFLIRERDVQPKEYALTIKDKEGMASSCVKHYRIKQLDNNDGYFITSRMKFQTLKQLVRYYSDSADGLCTKLTVAAPRMAPTRQDLVVFIQSTLMDELKNYKIQLQQVEAALIPNPENEELLKLREDLNEIIQLQESLLSEELAEEKPAPQPTSSLSSEKKISWKVGDRCLAPSKNGQHYVAVIDGISQDKTMVFKHMVKLHELRIAPVEDKKEYIFKTNKTANGSNVPKKEWQLERERRKFRAQKKEQRRKQMDEAQEQQKNKWLNFNTKATRPEKDWRHPDPRPMALEVLLIETTL